MSLELEVNDPSFQRLRLRGGIALSVFVQDRSVKQSLSEAILVARCSLFRLLSDLQIIHFVYFALHCEVSIIQCSEQLIEYYTSYHKLTLERG